MTFLLHCTRKCVHASGGMVRQFSKYFKYHKFYWEKLEHQRWFTSLLKCNCNTTNMQTKNRILNFGKEINHIIVFLKFETPPCHALPCRVNMLKVKISLNSNSIIFFLSSVHTRSQNQHQKQQQKKTIKFSTEKRRKFQETHYFLTNYFAYVFVCRAIVSLAKIKIMCDRWKLNRICLTWWRYFFTFFFLKKKRKKTII